MVKKYVTQSEFATQIGKSRSAVTQLVQRGKIPIENGKIPLDEALAAYSTVGKNGTNKTSEITGDVANIAVATKKAELVKKTAEAKIAQIELQERERKVVSVEEVTRDAQRVAEVIRTLLLSLPSRVALSLEMRAANDIQAILDDEINQILTKLHDTKF